MKKLIIVLLIFVSQLSAQSSKGRITLSYNDEKFDLPITQAYIRKENDVLVSARAEQNDSLGIKMVSLEFSIKSLIENAQLSNEHALRIFISNEVRNNRSVNKRFIFNYGPKDVNVEIYYGEEKLNWSSPGLKFKFSDVSTLLTKDGLLIKGSFSGKYTSKNLDSTLKTMAEIKDGYFEIIL